MGWYNSVWTRRRAITVDNSAGTTPADIDVVIPPDDDDFWSQIDASGLELRAVSWDSRTKLAYSVDNGSGGAFDKTNRLGRVRIDGATLVASAGIVCLWLYYGSTSAQGTGAVVTTIAAAKTGYIDLSRPRGRFYAYEAPTPNLVRPSSVLPPKRVSENCYVWIDVTPGLAQKMVPGWGTQLHEEVFWASMSVQNSSGTDQPTMYDVTKNRFVYHQPTGRMFVRVYVTAGTAATNYIVAPQVSTANPGDTAAAQVLIPTAGLPVRNTFFT